MVMLIPHAVRQQIFVAHHEPPNVAAHLIQSIFN